MLCKYCVKYNYTEMSLEELYTTNDMKLLKKAIIELTAKEDYKTLNTLFRCNPNVSKFDTRSLNEDIPQENKRFTKRNGKLCNVSKSIPRTNNEESNTYEYTYKARCYDPNTKSFGYVDKPIVNVSRIRARYY